MKKLAILLVGVIMCSAYAYSQTPDAARPFKLILIDKNGKLVKKNNVYYQLNGVGEARKVDDKGISIIQGITDKDTLLVMMTGYAGKFSLAGLDSVKLMIARNDILSFMRSYRVAPGMVSDGYTTISKESSTFPISRVEVHADPAMLAYNDLGAYLIGKFAGVQVSDGNIYIRGGSGSFMGRNSALIVLDGVQYDNLNTINSMVTMSQIKSIDVLKDGTSYGLRGSNGVVVITTVKK